MAHLLAKTILINQTVEIIAKEQKVSIKEAKLRLYKSKVIELLDDDETGLYGESAYFLFSLYEKYQNDPKL